MVLLRLPEDKGTMIAPFDRNKYRSILLHPDWAHQKYYGWRIVKDETGLRILHKRRAIFHRYLVLLSSGGEKDLNHWLKDVFHYTSLTDIVIHDFDRVFEHDRTSQHFLRSSRQERLMNIGTFVLDLRRDLQTLLRAMSPDYRRKLRKAEKLGITIEAHFRPSDNLADAFVQSFNDFAVVRKLNPVALSTVKRMYANGDAVLFTACREGELSSFLNIYTAGKSGIFMHCVNISQRNDGVGQYIHWKAIEWLKHSGFHWYDLGGVASNDKRDGIYNFKEKFGGDFIDLGIEWRSVGMLTKRAIYSASMLSRFVRRSEFSKAKGIATK
jgi:hypothetical protein